MIAFHSEEIGKNMKKFTIALLVILATVSCSSTQVVNGTKGFLGAVGGGIIIATIMATGA